MLATNKLSPSVLTLNPRKELESIQEWVRAAVYMQLRRRGVVVGLSGGVDSSVTAAVCASALGSSRVLGLIMPEEESSPESEYLGVLVAERLGIQVIKECVTPMLRACGCYERRDRAIRSVLREYSPGWKSKIALPNMLHRDRYPVYSVCALSPEGVEHRVRLTADASLEIVAATNFKQRARKMVEYYHADRVQYAVAGTPNRLEFDQGFFVKMGDGSADLKPIAHLYKTQVYQMAEYLGIPPEVRLRPPTTDTYSLGQSQEEFYFSIPLDKMDLCLYGKDHNIQPEAVAEAVDLTPDEVVRVYHQIDARRRMARYLHCQALSLSCEGV
jgi:NAD+ synthase